MQFDWFKKIPLMYQYAVAIFTLVALGSLLLFPGADFLVHLLAAIFLPVFFDIAFWYIKTRKLHAPYSAYITGVIIGLLLSPSHDFSGVLLVSFLAIGSKHLLKWKSTHIFNPAAFGLVLGNLILPFSLSWHGVSSILLILPLGLLLMYLTKTLATGVVFFISFTILLAFWAIVLGNNPLIILENLVFIGTTVFFAFFMIVEPKTAPALPIAKKLFGITVALLCFASLSLAPELFPLLGLLTANALRWHLTIITQFISRPAVKA